MNCPYCNFQETKVIDSRETNELTTRRRRECLKCSKRFTTYERPETIELFVIKKDGRREPFNREKIKAGLLKACEKRPVPQEKIEKTLDEIENKLKTLDSTEVHSKVIGELIMKKLKTLDKVAYIRFASVYRDFTDLKSFEEEVKKLIKNK